MKRDEQSKAVLMRFLGSLGIVPSTVIHSMVQWYGMDKRFEGDSTFGRRPADNDSLADTLLRNAADLVMDAYDLLPEGERGEHPRNVVEEAYQHLRGITPSARDPGYDIKAVVKSGVERINRLPSWP